MDKNHGGKQSQKNNHGGQGGGQQLRRLRRRGRTSTMCPAITEEVAAGRFCGEKKKGRRTAETAPKL